MTAAEQVLNIVKASGGGVSVTEISYKAGLPLVEVLDALEQLEQQGKVTPWSWGLGLEAA